MGPVLALFFAYAGPLGAYFPALYPTRVRSMGAGFCFNVGRGVAAFAPYALGALASHIGLSMSIALCAVGFGLSGFVMLLLPDNPASEPATRSADPTLLAARQPPQAELPVPASGK